ncbi:MAG: phenylalanine--tRNA ligase subunit beta [Deltaproteobacteria bacterium]
MKFTYNWLKDFVDIKLRPEQLAHKLTMAGIEVESVEEVGGDFVFEAEITSNRPDWLSVFGIAREIAAITSSKLKAQNSKLKKLPWGKEKPRLEIKIEDKRDCPLYNAKIILGVKVIPSPRWLRERLELVGCHSVNNIVDITNYIMFSWGQPLHAFDFDKLEAGGIIVRRAKPGEKLTLIDGQEKLLDQGILVIADKRRCLAVAGVMGGKDTEVEETTRNVLLEAAAFNPPLVRQGRRALALQSESSYRFERGVDLKHTERISSLATVLIGEIAGGNPVLNKSSAYPKTKIKVLELNADEVRNVLGADKISTARVKNILDNLGFGAKAKTKNKLTVTVPSHRQDVNLQADLIEEVARIFGYENMPTTLPAIMPQISSDSARDLVYKAKNILTGLGLHEVVTYSLIDNELLKNFAGQEGSEIVEILNPLSKEQEILRPVLIPSLIGCVAYNLRQKQASINIFEIAKIYTKSGPQVQEKNVLGIALCGRKSIWLEQDQSPVHDEVGFLHLKGILEVLFQRLGIRGYGFARGANSDEFEVSVKNAKIGTLLKLRRETLDKFDIKNKEVFAAQVDFDKLSSLAQLNAAFKPYPRYPGISRDISLVLKEDIPVEQVMESITARGEGLLQEAEITDYYKGKQIPAGFKCFTISCLYCSDKRTLTEAEVNPIHSAVIDALKNKFQAGIR